MAVAVDPFTQAETSYGLLVAERKDGELDGRAFRAAVRELRVRDADGREWALSPADGQWYRRDRDRWTPGQPPRRLVCPACGHHNLTRHHFCTQCGVSLQEAD
jgi:hypothetical protein